MSQRKHGLLLENLMLLHPAIFKLARRHKIQGVDFISQTSVEFREILHLTLNYSTSFLTIQDTCYILANKRFDYWNILTESIKRPIKSKYRTPIQ
jgi:hypothetical protein